MASSITFWPSAARQAARNPIDTPARHTRVLYPALGWFLSGGDPAVLLWVLPGINLLAVGLLTLAGSVLAHSRGLSPWYGFLLPLAVNAALPLSRDLTDLLGLACLALFLVGWLESWSNGYLLLLCWHPCWPGKPAW